MNFLRLKIGRVSPADEYDCFLLFDDLQNFHGAGLGADAAGDALGSGVLGLQHHDLHGAGLDALAASDAVFLIDHKNAGLGILGDGIVLTGSHALSALDAGLGLGAAVLTGNDPNAGIIRVEFLVKSLRAGAHTLQTGHTFHIFFNSELLHNRGFSFMYCLSVLL